MVRISLRVPILPRLYVKPLPVKASLWGRDEPAAICTKLMWKRKLPYCGNPNRILQTAGGNAFSSATRNENWGWSNAFPFTTIFSAFLLLKRLQNSFPYRTRRTVRWEVNVPRQPFCFFKTFGVKMKSLLQILNGWRTTNSLRTQSFESILCLN